MKLSYGDKNELRKIIVRKLESVPDGQMINLDKDVLENLLFKVITYNNETKEQLKLPVWTGEFLRKIDLSEVSFEDVSWSLIVNDTWDNPEDEYTKYMDKETSKNISSILPRFTEPYDQRIDFSMTNANIDFSKSFEFKKKGKINILFCDFEGVDLSNNDMSKIGSIFFSNLADTNITLTPKMFANRKSSKIGTTCLRNIDLSKFSYDALDLIRSTRVFEGDCDFTNTGLNVTIDPSAEEWHGSEAEMLKKDLGLLTSGLSGCYINGKKIVSNEEKKAIIEYKLREYEEYKQELFDSVSRDIDQQLVGMKM